MDQLTDPDQAAFDAVDDALRTFPLAAAPPALSPKVMARIRALAPAPRFRIRWLDFAVSLFIAGMVGLAILFWQTLPLQVTARAQMEAIFFLQHSGLIMLWPVLAGAGLGAALALLIAATVFTRARRPLA